MVENVVDLPPAKHERANVGLAARPPVQSKASPQFEGSSFEGKKK
jgi:hypothetical protein